MVAVMVFAALACLLWASSVFAASVVLQWDLPPGLDPAQYSINVYRITGTCPAAGSIPPAQVTALADSQETAKINGVASNAVDAKPATLWHTAYTPTPSPLPHVLLIDLGAIYTISGLAYLPRQDGQVNGMIAGYSITISQDGKIWSDPVAQGTWLGDLLEKQVSFPATPGRAVRLTALSEAHGGPWASAAEVRILGTPGVVAPATPRATVPATTQLYLDTGVALNTTYCWYTTLADAQGHESPQSNAVQLAAPTVPTLPAPTNVSVTPQ